MAKKRFYDGDYSGPLNKARREESRDFNMISEDHNAFANLPQQVVHKAWPKAGYYADYDLDDTIRGINEQQNADGSMMKRHKSKSKY